MHAGRPTTPISNAAITLAAIVLALGLLGALWWLFHSLTGGDAASSPGALAALQQPGLAKALATTLAVAGGAAILCSIVALPGAWLLARHAPGLAPVFTVLGLMALALSPLLSLAGSGLPGNGFATFTGLQRLGIPVEWLQLADLAGVYALHYLPWLVLAAWLSLRHDAGALRDLARVHAPAGWSALHGVLLPAILPGWLLGVGLMMLRIIEDAATPQRLDIESLLAPRLLQAVRSGAADPAVVAAISLMLVLAAALVVLLAWRGIFPRPRLRAMVSCREANGQGGGPVAWLLALPWLGIALLPYAGIVLTLPSTGPIQGMTPAPGWISPLVLFAVFCGSALALGGLLLAAAITRDGRLPGLVQQLACALLVLPTPVIAVLLTAALGGHGQLSPHQAWLALSLAVAIKWLPLAQVLVASRWLTVPHEMSDLVRLRRGAGHLAAPRRLLSTLQPTLVAVLLIGMLALSGEVTTALMLLPEDAPAPATELFRLALRDDPGPGLLLLSLAAAIGIMASLATLLQRTPRCPRPRRRYRDTDRITEPHG